MRDRIERYGTSATDRRRASMIKTPLRLRPPKKDADTEAIAVDLNEMERMLNEYLDFARRATDRR